MRRSVFLFRLNRLSALAYSSGLAGFLVVKVETSVEAGVALKEFLDSAELVRDS